MKKFALTMLGWLNVMVGFMAIGVIELSVHDYYHDHWTVVHIIGFAITLAVTASTTMLCFVTAFAEE